MNSRLPKITPRVKCRRRLNSNSRRMPFSASSFAMTFAFRPWRIIYGWHMVFDRLGLWTKARKCVATPTGKSRFVDGTYIRLH